MGWQRFEASDGVDPPGTAIETDMLGQFTLKNSALLYPAGGFDVDDDHFGVMLDDQEVGTIYRLDDEWFWSINLGMMGVSTGYAATRQEAREAFRAAWDEKAERLRSTHVTRARAIARGKP